MRSIEFHTNLNDKESYKKGALPPKYSKHRELQSSMASRLFDLSLFFMESGSLPSGHASQRANTMRKENCLSPQLSAANLFAYG